MIAIRSVAGADAAERTRRFSFLVTIVAALYGGYLYVPDNTAPYVTVAIDGHRGVYDSAWIGSMTAVLSSAFLTLVGFFLVRGSVERDRELHTDDVVAATPVRKSTFLLGKFASNLAVLVVLAAVMYGASVVMQLLRGEDRHLDVLAYLLPLLIVTVPSLAFVAALAVLFDVVKLLRGVLGGIAYFFLWTALLVAPLGLSAKWTAWTPLDPFGTTPVTAAMANGAQQAFQRVNLQNVNIGGSDVPAGGLTTFVFAGMHWTTPLIASRIAWLFVALLIVALAVPLFDRFQREDAGRQSKPYRAFDVASGIPNVAGLRLFRAELALLLNGSSLFWWIGAAALSVASGVVPLDVASKYLLPVALIWPIERWSALGCRERRWHVEDLIASAPDPIVRTLSAQWAAATIVGIGVAAGYIIRLFAAGDFSGALACVLALCAVAAAAPACGVVTGTPRLFEAAYLLVWYLGPINHLPQLDLTGATRFAPAALIVASLIVAALSLATAFLGRTLARTV